MPAGKVAGKLWAGTSEPSKAFLWLCPPGTTQLCSSFPWGPEVSGEGGSLISCRDSFAQEGHSKSYKSQKQNWEKKIPERDQVVLPWRVLLVFTHPDTALNPKSEAQRRVLEGSKGISCLKLN